MTGDFPCSTTGPELLSRLAFEDCGRYEDQISVNDLLSLLYKRYQYKTVFGELKFLDLNRTLKYTRPRFQQKIPLTFYQPKL